ncbi:hypothetical protein ACF1BQ_006310 [Bradyrhizobium sp. RDT10]
MDRRFQGESEHVGDQQKGRKSMSDYRSMKVHRRSLLVTIASIAAGLSVARHSYGAEAVAADDKGGAPRKKNESDALPKPQLQLLPGLCRVFARRWL